MKISNLGYLTTVGPRIWLRHMTKLLRIFCEKVCFSKKCFANFQLWNCNDFRIFYLIGEINSSIVHLIGTKEAHQMLNGGTGGTGSEKIKGQGTNRETMLRPLSEFRLKSSINSELKRSKVIKHIIDITILNPKMLFRLWYGRGCRRIKKFERFKIGMFWLKLKRLTKIGKLLT